MNQAARELIWEYRTTPWRSYRLQIISALGEALRSDSDSRILEFLVDLVRDFRRDTTMAESALLALGGSRNFVARRFLCSFYHECQESQGSGEILIPMVIAALGQLGERSLIDDWMTRLPEAIREKKILLSRNLILALAEVKAFQAEELFIRLLNPKSELPKPLRIPLLIALSKVGRQSPNHQHPSFTQLSHAFQGDFLEYQLFQGAVEQASLRARLTPVSVMEAIFSNANGRQTQQWMLELNGFFSAEGSLDPGSEAPSEAIEAMWREWQSRLNSENASIAINILKRLDLKIIEQAESVLGQGVTPLTLIANLVNDPSSNLSNTKAIKNLVCDLCVERPDWRPLGETPWQAQGVFLWSQKDSDEVRDYLRAWLDPTFLKSERTHFTQRSPEQQFALVNAVLQASEVKSTADWVPDFEELLLLVPENFYRNRARMIRGLARPIGREGKPSARLSHWLKECFMSISEPKNMKEDETDLLKSFLLFWSHVPQKNISKLILNFLDSRLFKFNELSDEDASLLAHAFRALLCQLRTLPNDSEMTLCEKWINQILIAQSDETITKSGKDLAHLDLLISTTQLIAEGPFAEGHFSASEAWSESLTRILQLKNLNDEGCVSVILALKRLKRESCADALAPFLKSSQPVVRGRVLDTLTVLPGLRAKRIVIDYLRDQADDLEVVDKIVRCFVPLSEPHPYFSDVIDEVLATLPEHPLKEGLLELKLKILNPVATTTESSAPSQKEKAETDRILMSLVSEFSKMPETVQSALRSAELPFLKPELFHASVDKSAVVVQLCKALDMWLEREVGKRLLLPRLESHLHEFQNVLHALGLNEEALSADQLIKSLGVQKFFNSQSFPLHKMSQMAQGILRGKILHDQLKMIDGLRAWGIILLLYGRKMSGKALLPLQGATDDQVASVAKRLGSLQDVRNPAAHRQTVLKLEDLAQVRSEVHALMNQMSKWW